MYVLTKEVIVSMKNIHVSLKITQQENQALHESIARLQNNWFLTSLGCVFTM
jgi:hypothetical protein